MIYQKINLKVDYLKKGISNGGFQPTLTTYVLENHESVDINRKRPFVLICPGGGYGHHSVREAEPIALAMNNAGYHAGVLHYSLAPMDFPSAFFDGVEALKLIRENIDDWNIDENQIVVMGFSAGGHLAASLGCWYKSKIVEKVLGYQPEDVRPNALCLCYPVILSGQFAHEGSVKNLIGNALEKPNVKSLIKSSFDFGDSKSDDISIDDLKNLVSLDTQVDKDFPPTFIWHTFEDSTVPMENSLTFAKALREKAVPFEMHIFSKGEHGLALGTKETSLPDGKYFQSECSCWVELFEKWLSGIRL